MPIALVPATISEMVPASPPLAARRRREVSQRRNYVRDCVTSGGFAAALKSTCSAPTMPPVAIPPPTCQPRSPGEVKSNGTVDFDRSAYSQLIRATPPHPRATSSASPMAKQAMADGRIKACDPTWPLGCKKWQGTSSSEDFMICSIDLFCAVRRSLAKGAPDPRRGAAFVSSCTCSGQMSDDACGSRPGWDERVARSSKGQSDPDHRRATGDGRAGGKPAGRLVLVLKKFRTHCPHCLWCQQVCSLLAAVAVASAPRSRAARVRESELTGAVSVAWPRWRSCRSGIRCRVAAAEVKRRPRTRAPTPMGPSKMVIDASRRP
jgi:hypothetical protein